MTMENTPHTSSVLIKADKETVWNAITKEDKLIQWYAPGSPWKIPNLKALHWWRGRRFLTFNKVYTIRISSKMDATRAQ